MFQHHQFAISSEKKVNESSSFLVINISIKLGQDETHSANLVFGSSTQKRINRDKKNNKITDCDQKSRFRFEMRQFFFCIQITSAIKSFRVFSSQIICDHSIIMLAKNRQNESSKFKIQEFIVDENLQKHVIFCHNNNNNMETDTREPSRRSARYPQQPHI